MTIPFSADDRRTIEEVHRLDLPSMTYWHIVQAVDRLKVDDMMVNDVICRALGHGYLEKDLPKRRI